MTTDKLINNRIASIVTSEQGCRLDAWDVLFTGAIIFYSKTCEFYFRSTGDGWTCAECTDDENKPTIAITNPIVIGILNGKILKRVDEFLGSCK